MCLRLVQMDFPRWRQQHIIHHSGRSRFFLEGRTVNKWSFEWINFIHLPADQRAPGSNTNQILTQAGRVQQVTIIRYQHKPTDSRGKHLERFSSSSDRVPQSLMNLISPPAHHLLLHRSSSEILIRSSEVLVTTCQEDHSLLIISTCFCSPSFLLTSSHDDQSSSLRSKWSSDVGL